MSGKQSRRASCESWEKAKVAQHTTTSATHFFRDDIKAPLKFVRRAREWDLARRQTCDCSSPINPGLNRDVRLAVQKRSPEPCPAPGRAIASMIRDERAWERK